MRIVSLALAILAAVVPAGASAGVFSLGMTGGAVRSQIKFDTERAGSEEMDRYTGWSAGGQIEYAFGSIVSARVAPTYTQRGYSMPVPTYLRYDDTLSAYVGYLSVPLLLRARMPLGTVAPYLLIGPRIDIKLHTHEDRGIRILLGEVDGVSYGYTAGGGLEYLPQPNLGVFGEIAYHGGSGAIFDGNGLDLKVDAFELSGGIRFRL